MKTAIVFVLFLFSAIAVAQDCATVIRAEAQSLGAPVAVKSRTAIPGDLLVLTTEDAEHRFADQATVLQREYFPNLYAAALGVQPDKMRLGVVEGKDGHRDPALWLMLYVERDGQCTSGRIGDRVYGSSNEAPAQFLRAIRDWEQAHPLSSLVDGRDPRIQWK